MVPKGVAVADGVLLMMRLYSGLPSGPSRGDLQKICGFTLKGTIRRRQGSGAGGISEEPSGNGSTVYDSDGNLMTLDHTVMRGNSAADATRTPGLVNEGNFSYQRGPSHQRWFNRHFNGADTESPLEGAAFAQLWLKRYTSRGPRRYIRRIAETKLELYEEYYSEELCRREKTTPNTLDLKINLAPNPNSAPKRELILKLKLPPRMLMLFPKVTTPRNRLGAATLAELDEGGDDGQGEKEIPLAHKLGKRPSRLKIPARVKPPEIYALEESNEDTDDEESREKMGSAPTKTHAADISAGNLENLALPPPKDMSPVAAVTATETLTKMKRELTAREREVEDMRRMVAEAEEKAIAEEKIAAEKAAAEEAASKLAKETAQLNTDAAGKTLKNIGRSIKYGIAAYIAQRKAEAADKTLVGKLDEELMLHFQEGLSIIANEPQKRKHEDGESENMRPTKVPKKWQDVVEKGRGRREERKDEEGRIWED